ncbi:hypothetical protein SAMN02745165_00575 [Malonomonas rubra DSM 5091]|uniref:Tetratricopeptide repeat-containing protein n=1 Tax=Malonomonas rubra DSM 5091 TaxID=1122189 RepID=A0A1M6D7J6_MALRU|nr:hypothetical protein [Malonomonas rubra]SHI69185.1 hypothetical protein SAMN02745165_00575 [Malonomonas rubra DSM 5091]
MRYWVRALCLSLALLIYYNLFGVVWEDRGTVRKNAPAAYILPSEFTRVLAFGQHGLLSDFLFLKTLTFVGGRSQSDEAMAEDDWLFVHKSLGVITDLDPYFVDPYMLAEGLLAWDARRPEEANEILRKGVKYRDWDWRFPFFIGFNSYYFLQDYETAATYIMQASKLPGSPEYLKTLGARLAYYGGKSKTALLFLKQMLAETDEPLLRRRLAMRLEALEGAVQIEEALDRYHEKRGQMPERLGDLVAAGYLLVMPKDPYGGEWVLMKSGRVFSTSKFAESESGH